ncbi:unnamed protein product [Aphanomyces euteiches]|uniref:Sugar fermentation stimulation protein C-terminal domain-containing protein n=1 Tax=Aphanomyces euteiches TaxID=100861 RepID=A0A6G0XYQ4_9STRA|nr:hypothetical protein Ae201684_000076 [Aphanomyces euteiches]
MVMATQRQLRSSAKTRALHTEDVLPLKKPRRAPASTEVDTEPTKTSSKKSKPSPKRVPSLIATTPVEGPQVLHAFPELVSGQLVQRYKRFLADVKLDDGTVVTVHCPNTGPMVGLLDQPMAPVQLSVSSNLTRKYKYTLEMISVDDVWIGVHSASANRMVETALRNGWMPDVAGPDRRYTSLQAEVKHAKGSRVDFVLESVSTVDAQDVQNIYTEVKSVTLLLPGQGNDGAAHRRAVFPDTVSTRASKHVEELIHRCAKSSTDRAAIIFLVQRGDCDSFSPSMTHDPVFAALCREASEKGVRLHAYACDLVPASRHVVLLKSLPIVHEDAGSKC